VHHHHLNPWKLIVRGTGESVQIWRMGQVTTAPAPVPAPVPAPTTSPGSAHTFSIYGLPAGYTLNVRSGPGLDFPVVGSVREGQAVNLTCQTRGAVVVGSSVWDMIGPGQYVSDWFVNTPGVNQLTPGAPVCARSGTPGARAF
jgi:hypothetical protein